MKGDQEAFGSLVEIYHTKFSGRFNSYFILDALKAMEGDNITISYTLEGHFATLHPVLLKDDTENIHIIMPMKVN